MTLGTRRAFTSVYDSSNGWENRVTVEKPLPSDPGSNGGAGRSIPPCSASTTLAWIYVRSNSDINAALG